MRIIEHRRHAMRSKPGQHLSQTGVDLARKIGKDLGPFTRVVTSTVPRAFETAIAMGFAVNEQSAELATLPEGFEDEVRWDEGFARFTQVIREIPQGNVAQFARRLFQLHQRIIDDVPDNSRVLIISHGGIVEASAVGCASGEAFETWGPACDYCEGVRLYFNGTHCEKAVLLKVNR